MNSSLSYITFPLNYFPSVLPEKKKSHNNLNKVLFKE